MKSFVAAAGLALLLLSGCAGIFVPATSDPYVKLSDAQSLLTQNRPLIAEKLLLEARDEFRKKGDMEGIGFYYTYYADFLTSDAVRFESFYQDKGFRGGEPVTFSSRQDDAQGYFRKSIPLLQSAADSHQSAKRYDSLTRANYSLSYAYAKLGETDKACLFLDRTLEAYRANKQQNPESKTYRDSSTSSIEGTVKSRRQRLGCA